MWGEAGEWRRRLNKVSDGQRRRVQICLGLLKPYQVLLLDEITVDLDVVGRCLPPPPPSPNGLAI